MDKEIQKFFSGSQTPSIIGESGFKQWIFDKMLEDTPLELKSKIVTEINFVDIVTAVADFHKQDISYILDLKRGPQSKNMARKIAMYLCQQLTGKPQKEIAKYFNLRHTGSVSYTTHIIRVMIRENKKFANEIDRISNSIIRQVI